MLTGRVIPERVKHAEAKSKKGGLNMKEHMADWRIHALAFVLTVIAEFIGTKKFSFGPLSFSLFPMLYVLILGAILGISKMIPKKMMTEASPYIGISVMMLTAKIASTIGPNLGAVVKAGPALILQEFGNLGTAVLALPIAIFVFHMGRAAIGTSFSISRESSLAVVADKYGLDMLKAASSIAGMSVEELIKSDFKTFVIEGKNLGIGQIMTLDFDSIKENIDEYVNKLDDMVNTNYNVVVIFVTDIIRKGSYVIYNSKAEELVKDSYGLQDVYQGVFIPGMVSRKKQMLPNIMEKLEQE